MNLKKLKLKFKHECNFLNLVLKFLTDFVASPEIEIYTAVSCYAEGGTYSERSVLNI